jgi:cholestenol Delta-isomerase
MAQKSSPLHPYYPLGVLIPDYVENTISTFTILAWFTAACTIILGSSLVVIRSIKPKLSNGDIATSLWFVLCAFIHLGIEG